jgi:hypothetical protein
MRMMATLKILTRINAIPSPLIPDPEMWSCCQFDILFEKSNLLSFFFRFQYLPEGVLGVWGVVTLLEVTGTGTGAVGGGLWGVIGTGIGLTGGGERTGAAWTEMNRRNESASICIQS